MEYLSIIYRGLVMQQAGDVSQAGYVYQSLLSLLPITEHINNEKAAGCQSLIPVSDSSMA